MFKKIRCKFKYEIRYWPRAFIKGIKNLIVWFPIVWLDRQWDHTYIYKVFRHKLHLTEKFTRKDGCHTKHIQDADKLKKCVLLLDRLLKDEYHENVFKSHYKKWGEPKMEFEDLKDQPGYSSLHINYPNVKTEKDDELESKEFRMKSKTEQEMKEQDLDLLFQIIRKNIQTWWD